VTAPSLSDVMAKALPPVSADGVARATPEPDSGLEKNTGAFGKIS
jgi:hypothetical protein